MKKLFKKITSSIRRSANRVRCAISNAAFTARTILRNPVKFTKAALTGNAGEGYIDTAVKILIAVVLGALLLAGLYALFGDVVMPTLETRIREMFDYAG
ncbi:MAG: DUF6133 family protein [Synergistaceae bacterium]|nr:DUF6133 family protein [Proteiniphilum sp.]MDD3963155.1 DUF6133 family protein [Synergistaceae bacterium]